MFDQLIKNSRQLYMSILRFLKRFWWPSETHHRPKDGKLRFQSISVVSKTPTNESIRDGDFIQVIYKNKSMWVLFRCPCGCQTIISLSLQKVHNPHWRLNKSNKGRPSLYPSIWQKRGCQSHFWITDGFVNWARFIDDED